jgi:hypothetical protein
MRLNLRNFCFVVCMSGMLLMPVLTHADSVNVQVNDQNGSNGDDINSRFTWGIGLGGAALGDGFGNAYSAGYGLDGNVGLKVDRNLAFLLAIDSYIFNSNTGNFYNGEVNFMPSVRLTLAEKHSEVKPYLIAGAGLNDNIEYYQTFYGTDTVNAVSPVVGGGIGIAFRVDHKLDVYIQGKYEDVLATGGSFSYFPIAAGVQFN